MSKIDYLSVRHQIATGDVILWQGKGLLSWLIRRWSKYSHASLVVRFQRGHRNRVFLVEALSKGLVLRSLSSRMLKQKGQVFWLHVNANEIERGRAWEYAIEACSKGIKYDFGSLIKNMFGRVSQNARKFFCSEFVWWTLAKSGIVKLNNEQRLKSKAPRPGDLPVWIGGKTTEIYIKKS